MRCTRLRARYVLNRTSSSHASVRTIEAHDRSARTTLPALFPRITAHRLPLANALLTPPSPAQPAATTTPTARRASRTPPADGTITPGSDRVRAFPATDHHAARGPDASSLRDTLRAIFKRGTRDTPPLPYARRTPLRRRQRRFSHSKKKTGSQISPRRASSSTRSGDGV